MHKLNLSLCKDGQHGWLGLEGEQPKVFGASFAISTVSQCFMLLSALGASAHKLNLALCKDDQHALRCIICDQHC